MCYRPGRRTTKKSRVWIDPAFVLVKEINASKGYLENWILVQNDAKLMPNVVQGGREEPRVAGLPTGYIPQGWVVNRRCQRSQCP